MPDWVSKAECKRCKKKGRLSLNCPPRYDNKPFKSKNEQRYNKYNNKETANVCEFAGMASHHFPHCWTCSNQQTKDQKSRHHEYQPNHNISLNNIQDIYLSRLNQQKSRQHIRENCQYKKNHIGDSTNKFSSQLYNKFYSYKYHKREISKICNTHSTIPSHKFKKLMRHFHKKDPNFSTYKKSIISFFMASFDKINQNDLISILWLFCHLHSSKKFSLHKRRFNKHRNRSQYQSTPRQRKITDLPIKWWRHRHHNGSRNRIYNY